MKTINYIKESSLTKFPNVLSIKSFILCAVIMLGIQMHLKAQDSIKYTAPSWYFGVAGGGNINFYRGSTENLNASLSVPTTFHNGQGLGLFVAPLIEYRPANSRWGIILQAGYDDRKGVFDQVTTPCNCPADLLTDLSYWTIEPSLRFAPFKSGLYLFAGPRLGLNKTKSFTYQLGLNPDIPTQELTDAISGDFSNIRPSLISMQFGLGIDMPLTSSYKKNQLILSPFIAYQPYFGQDPRSIETWNINTIRVGASLKLGTGRKIQNKFIEPEKVYIAAPTVIFKVISPNNTRPERQVREVFPLRNYVFFDLGSQKIPGRYVLLNKKQAQTFKEEDFEMVTPENFSDRSKRQMIVYYNILNILGNRMSQNPISKIDLVGSSKEGTADGFEMATSIKNYLVTNFDIDPNRILCVGRNRPLIPSGQQGGTKELTLLEEGDRRVSIETNSPALLMEFQSGQDAPLKPITFNASQIAPLDSYVSFVNEDATKIFNSWTLELTDNNGIVQYYGPYMQDKVSMPGSTILGKRLVGDFNVKMIGNTKENVVIVRETTAHIVLWKPILEEEGTRFSIIYEFNKSESLAMYHKYLKEIVIPKIPINGTVIIQGHTDIIGEENHNQALSVARAKDVMNIIQSNLKANGRNDVKFEVSGLGEDEKNSPFDNKYPEERFYNRTVTIDIVP
jgi:outer membrane protein OmpA-like peptidoglycan-associated protein